MLHRLFLWAGAGLVLRTNFFVNFFCMDTKQWHRACLFHLIKWVLFSNLITLCPHYKGRPPLNPMLLITGPGLLPSAGFTACLQVKLREKRLGPGWQEKIIFCRAGDSLNGIWKCLVVIWTSPVGHRVWVTESWRNLPKGSIQCTHTDLRIEPSRINLWLIGHL